jgi:hypothetical protein
MRWIWTVLLAAALTVSLAGCSWFSFTSTPVRAAVPMVPTVANGQPACGFSDGFPTGNDVAGEVTVDPNPSGAIAIWLPGLDRNTCPVRVIVDPAQAVRLAADVRSAPKIPPGVYNCPADFGVGVDLYFAYAGRAQAQLVSINLSGCTGIGAPGREGRQLPDAARAELATLAPPGWARYF